MQKKKKLKNMNISILGEVSETCEIRKTILHANLTEFGDSRAINSNNVLNNDIRIIRKSYCFGSGGTGETFH